MGDILHALPAVTALRQAHPEWVIDWVVEPRWRALLALRAAMAAVRPSRLWINFTLRQPRIGRKRR